MQKRRTRSTFLWLLALLSVCAAAPGAFAAPQGRQLPRNPKDSRGRRRGWDYLRVDPDTHRIYISRGRT